MATLCSCGNSLPGTRRRVCDACKRERERTRERRKHSLGRSTRKTSVVAGHRATTEERFEVKVQRTDGCWNWLGTLNGRGYGQFWDGKRLVRAHRWSYERHVAPIPDGMTIDHLCTNKACVRPDHLEAVSNGENTRRARKLNGVSPEILSCELNKFGVPVTLEYQETPLNRQNGEPRLL